MYPLSKCYVGLAYLTLVHLDVPSFNDLSLVSFREREWVRSDNFMSTSVVQYNLEITHDKSYKTYLIVGDFSTKMQY